MSSHDESLEVSWAALQQPSVPDAADILRGQASPGDLVIGTATKVLAIIKPNGRILLAEGYEPEEAAARFWEGLARRRYDYEQQSLLHRHLESVLTRLGQADLAHEAVRRRVAEGDPDAGSEAGGTLVRLELMAQEAIELGRGLVGRGLPIPRIPDQIPDRIRNNPNSAYRGAEGIPQESPPEDVPNRD